MSRKKVPKHLVGCLIRKWLAPALCLIGLGMVLSIVVPFWIWVLVGGIGLMCYGFWSYFS